MIALAPRTISHSRKIHHCELKRNQNTVHKTMPNLLEMPQMVTSHLKRITILTAEKNSRIMTRKTPYKKCEGDVLELRHKTDEEKKLAIKYICNSVNLHCST